jgi:hypothetical protein
VWLAALVPLSLWINLSEKRYRQAFARGFLWEGEVLPDPPRGRGMGKPGLPIFLQLAHFTSAVHAMRTHRPMKTGPRPAAACCGPIGYRL